MTKQDSLIRTKCGGRVSHIQVKPQVNGVTFTAFWRSLFFGAALLMLASTTICSAASHCQFSKARRAICLFRLLVCPKGETHEDWGYFSYDRSRKVHVLRQFHVEGFVTQYYAQTLTADGKTIVFLSESLENLPAGFKARETYKILNENEFVEVFELAPPGKEFSVYSENHFKRQQ